MTTGSCLMCGIPTSRSCSGCKSVYYCNEPHQKKDWKSHKEYCSKVKTATNTFDAILFSESETKPRLVKVPWDFFVYPGDDTPSHKLDTTVWFKRPHSAVRPQYVYKWGINGPPLEHDLCFMFDDNFGMNNSPINRCVEAVTGGKPGHQWCGNILAVRMGKSYDFYESVDMGEDLKPLVKYFEEYGTVMPVE